MPIFHVDYKRDGVERELGVVAPNLDSALDQFRTRKPDCTVLGVVEGEKVLNRPAPKAKTVSDVPTWTSKSGKTKAISKVKTPNLKAIKARLQRAGCTDIGVYRAVVNELAIR